MHNPYRISFPAGPLQADVELPLSKSISNRALIISALSHGRVVVDKVAECDDTDAMRNALACGKDEINIGAAGTAMRFLTGFFAASPGAEVALDGSERMRNRPIATLVDMLRRCGADIAYLGREGFPPLKISGRRLAAHDMISVSSSMSSQYISSLLMISPMMPTGVNLTISGEQYSMPYIDMTLRLMQQCGAKCSSIDGTIEVLPGEYTNTHIIVESDWSASSYWYEIAAIRRGSRFVLHGLTRNSVQGDSKVAQYFRRLGVDTEYTEDGVVISSNLPISTSLDINLSGEPDLAPAIIVTASALGVPFHISGLATLKIKETDRLAAINAELAKVGVILQSTDEAVMHNGDMKSITVNDNVTFATYDDHRMAMSMAPLALLCSSTGSVDVANPEVVTKSYPEFFNHVKSIREL